jgi:DNA-binding GntR family transcriptional regulator
MTATSLKGIRATETANVAKSKPKPDADRAGLMYRALCHAIIEQALEPGAKLPEDSIEKHFGASRQWSAR